MTQKRRAARLRKTKITDSIEKRLFDLLSFTLPDLVLLKDGDGRWKFANKEALGFLGLSTFDWADKTDRQIIEAFPSLEKDLMVDSLTDQKAWAAGLRRDLIERLTDSRTGLVHVFSVIKVPVSIEKGKQDHLLVVARDITDIVEEKDSILREREWYQTLFSMVGEPSFLSLITPEGNLSTIIEANSRAKLVYGYSDAEFKSLRMVDLMAPAEREHCLRVVFPRLLADGHLEYESAHLSKEGREILVDVSAKILEKDGKQFLLTLIRDKTIKRREKLIERILAESERRVLMGENLQKVLDDLCDALVRFFPFMYLGILKKEPDGATELVAGDIKGKIRYRNNTSARWDESPQGMGVSGHAIRKGKTHMIAISDSSYPEVFKKEMESVGIRFIWSVPLTQRNGEVMGTITSGSRYLFGPAPEELSIIEKYSDRIALLFDLAEEQKEVRFGYEALQTVGDAISMVDPEGVIRWVNDAFIRLTGYSREECLGQTHRILKSGHHGQAFYEELWSTIFSGNVFECEIVNKRKDGSEFVAAQTITPLIAEEGKVARFISVQRDITHKKENELRIWKMANYDPLTGLANRNLLRERATRDIEDSLRKKTVVNLLFMDLDHFKAVNDSMGHEIGDILLKLVAERLLRLGRESDTISRLGGDEFVYVQPESRSREDGIALGERILEIFCDPFQLADQTIHISVSIGVVSCPEDGEELDGLLRKSDIALYKAKNRGGGRVECFELLREDISSERLALIESIRNGLQNGEFVLFYQPVFLLSDARMVGVESLIRWRREPFDIVLPCHFISLFEETGMIHDLGENIVREGVLQAKSWMQSGMDPSFRIAINISPVQLQNPGFFDMVVGILAENSVNASEIGLEFEVTESRPIQSENALNTLVRLREIGIRISIDDFGTGYSSISLLRGFPVDTLKIDQSFIRDIRHDRNARSMIRAIVTMAKSLGLSLVAEGVEFEEERIFLQEIGCDFFQGFLWGHPLPPEEVIGFYHSTLNKS
ncbi:MAG: EAL domain-containing protein [Nitrospiraceae bacterium]|nr:EAL domain-containing protein [Nitrospiraceae bacterium]